MRDLNPQTAVHADIIPPLSQYAQATIDHLDLAAHPEGGWYKRTWQSPLEYGNSERPLASLIYFLLPQGDFSDWHLVDADELWLWHGPNPVEIEVCDDDPRTLTREELAEKTVRTKLYISDTAEDVAGDSSGDSAHDNRKSSDNVAGNCAQCLVKAGQWQRTLPVTGDALVSCVVSPGFTFEGFTVIDE